MTFKVLVRPRSVGEVLRVVGSLLLPRTFESRSRAAGSTSQESEVHRVSVCQRPLFKFLFYDATLDTYHTRASSRIC